uniref:Uncharacterized protein n=1 Tax=Arundo donax TaxID=35708 RepID=A0A0A9E673_ARUDO
MSCIIWVVTNQNIVKD